MKTYDLDHISIDEIVNEMANPDRELRTIVAENMLRYGGSFVKALSHCFVLADHENIRKLSQVFVGYVISYQPKNWERKEEDVKKEIES